MQHNLIALRKEAGLTQGELAKLLHISVTSYNQKERGRMQFKQDEMFKIATILGRDIEHIFLPRGHRFGDKGV